MPATTPKGLPYPLGTDRVMDGDDNIRRLAQAVENYVQAGTAQVPAGSDGNTHASVAVVFPVPYAAPPVVQLSSTTGVPAGAGNSLFMWVTGLTAQGFERHRPAQPCRSRGGGMAGRGHHRPGRPHRRRSGGREVNAPTWGERWRQLFNSPPPARRYYQRQTPTPTTDVAGEPLEPPEGQDPDPPEPVLAVLAAHLLLSDIRDYLEAAADDDEARAYLLLRISAVMVVLRRVHDRLEGSAP